MRGVPVVEDLTEDELDRQINLYGPLADVIRGLVDASVRTEADAEVIRDVTQVLQSQLERLRAQQSEEPFGIRWTTLGKRRSWGNAVIGLRNPIAVPLDLQVDGDGRVWADFELGLRGPTPSRPRRSLGAAAGPGARCRRRGRQRTRDDRDPDGALPARDPAGEAAR